MNRLRITDQYLDASGISLNNVETLKEYFDLSVSGSKESVSGLPTGVTNSIFTVNWKLNSEKTFGKIYGKIQLDLAAGTTLTNQVLTIPLGFSVKATGSAYYIECGMGQCFTWNATTGSINAVPYVYLDVAADGAVTLRITGLYNNSSVKTRLFIVLPACVYFFYDFGDDISVSS